MLANLLDGVVDLARKSRQVKVERGLPDNKVLLIRPGGESEMLDGNRQTHSDSPATFASLLEWASATQTVGKLVFAVSESGVSASVNRDSPHDSDTAKLALQHTAAFEDLLRWMQDARHIKQLVRGLRTSLAGTFPEEYLRVFRRVDFKRKNDGSRATSHAGESMGRSVEVAAQSTDGEIPETLVFNLALFGNVPCSTTDLRFAVDVDAVSEVVAIRPIGDAMADAIKVTRDDLVARLREEFSDSLVIDSK